VTGITDITNNQKLVSVCRWDHDGTKIVLVTYFEVFYREECLTDKLPCGEHDAKMMVEHKNELA